MSSQYIKHSVTCMPKRYALAAQEQLVVKSPLGARVCNGPGYYWTVPFEQAEQREAERLGELGWVKVEHGLEGTSCVHRGPKLLFLGPFDEVKERGQAVSLGKGSGTYLLVEDASTGVRSIVCGPCVWWPTTHQRIVEWREAISLGDAEWLKLKDKQSGRVWVERGPRQLFLEPDHVLLTPKPRPAISLKPWEYCRIVDRSTGDVRVERGGQLLFLEPHDELEGDVQQAVKVDARQAVLILDKLSGAQSLLTAPQLFFPKATEEVLEARPLITLADYEACIVKEQSGALRFHRGTDPDGGAFFLPPHCELLELLWSRGRRRERRDLRITKVDQRPQYMSFEFNCRSSDNVELVLEGTFFWQITDVASMVANTADLTGDICSHARSQFISLISRETLKDFMADFNSLAKKAASDHDDFYSRRGVRILTLEVTGYRCAEQATADILQQIIQEGTNRLNRLSQAESESEVAMFKIRGMIEQEQLNTQLLAVQQEHKKQEARVQGEAEAEKVLSFLRGVAEAVPDPAAASAMWGTLRKGDALATLSDGSAQLYFTPAECNLSIESHTHKT